MSVKIVIRSRTNPTYFMKYNTGFSYAEWLGYDPMSREIMINAILAKDFTVEVYNDIEQAADD